MSLPAQIEADPGASARQDLWAYRAAILVALLLVAVRSFVFVWYEQADFDSDQAIIGLMAKHLAEGRAFPLFQYMQDYVLVVEAWLAAIVFWIAGASVLTLKAPVVALNGVAAWLLLRILTVEVGLRPSLAVIAAAFFLFPAPITSATLVESLGMTVEPIVFVLLLWVTRRQPIVFGVVLGVGFLVREFTLYGLAAILLIEAADGSLFQWPTLRGKLVSACAFVGVWEVVRLLRPFSSPLGPGSSYVPAAGGSNLTTLAGMFNFQPGHLPGYLRALAVEHLANLFGARPARLAGAAINSTVTQGTAWLWPVLAGALVLGSVVLAWRLRRQPPETSAAVKSCAYLVLVGVLAALMYAIGRGPRMSLFTMRYILLSLLAPIGVFALWFRLEPSRRLRAAAVCVVGLTVGTAAVDHGRLFSEYRHHRPRADHRTLANYLVASHIRYGQADYWTAYQVVFLARERVKLAAPEFSRISEYERLFEANRSEAVTISRQACPQGTHVRGWYICGP